MHYYGFQKKFHHGTVAINLKLFPSITIILLPLQLSSSSQSITSFEDLHHLVEDVVAAFHLLLESGSSLLQQVQFIFINQATFNVRCNGQQSKIKSLTCDHVMTMMKMMSTMVMIKMKVYLANNVVMVNKANSCKLK